MGNRASLRHKDHLKVESNLNVNIIEGYAGIDADVRKDSTEITDKKLQEECKYPIRESHSGPSAETIAKALAIDDVQEQRRDYGVANGVQSLHGYSTEAESSTSTGDCQDRGSLHLTSRSSVPRSMPSIQDESSRRERNVIRKETLTVVNRVRSDKLT